MWKFIDETHPFYNLRAADKYRPEFVRIWQRVDQILGTLFECAHDVNILIVSDHGFGPAKGSFYVNTWLEREKLLFWKHGSTVTKTWSSALSKMLQQMSKINPRLHRCLLNIGRRHRRFVEGPSAWIDLSRTLAFCWSSSQCGNIYINDLPHSPVQTKADYVAVRSKVVDGLRRISGERGIEIDISLAEEVYHGKYVGLAPAIVFEVDNFGYLISNMPSNEVFSSRPSSPNASGTHRRNGIFLACGPDIQESYQLEGATIYDIAPTILHLLGVPVPTDMDGRVLMQILRKGSEVANREVRFQEESPNAEMSHYALSEDEIEQVENHLRGLGYID